jgi:hypothetical protein
MATVEELRQHIEGLEDRIKTLEDKGQDFKDTQIGIRKDFINIFDIVKCRRFIFDTFYSQASEPIIPINSFAFWYDTDAPAYYLLFNFNGTQKKVALT